MGSGQTIALDTLVVGSLEGVARTGPVDALTGAVVAAGQYTDDRSWADCSEWGLERAVARYDLQAQPLDASGRVLYRSQVLAVSWTPAVVSLSASAPAPPAGSPAVLTVTARPGTGFLDDTYSIRIVESGTGSVLADRPGGSGQERSVPLVRSPGTADFVGRLVLRSTGQVLAGSSPVRIEWR